MRELIYKNIDLVGLTGIPKEELLYRLLKDPSKRHFIRNILEIPEFELPINLPKSHSYESTIFIEICNQIFHPDRLFCTSQFLPFLYRYDIEFTQLDKNYISDTYRKIQGKPDLECLLGMIIVFMKLDNPEDYILATRGANFSTICAIVSIKNGDVFGKNFENILVYLNYAVPYYKQNAEMILKAISYYEDKVPEVKEVTRRSSFVTAKQRHLLEAPVQDKEFKNILLKIFPQLSTDI